MLMLLLSPVCTEVPGFTKAALLAAGMDAFVPPYHMII